jgi:hypothetical protein
MANLSNINNKFIVTDEGNVLIGKTANSSGRLQIKDTQTSNFNDGLAITRNNAAQTGYINMVGGAFNFNSPGLSYKFRNNGTQTLELNSSGNATFTGNVGIGAAASDGNLHVRKTGINTGITNVLMNANFADGSNGTGLSIGYRTDETTAVLAARTATGNIAFYSYDGGWSESMRISNTGNVGIGTDSPSSTLDVRGSGEWYDAGIIVRRDAAPTQFGTISQYNGSLNLISVVGGGGGNGEIMFSNHNAATGTPTERMRIDSSGNVGIGTTNPGAQLELKKETTWGTLDNQVIYINNTGTGGNTGALHDMGSITWRSGNVNTAAISGIRNTPGSGNNVDLRFTTATQSGGQQTSMTILSGGNVGIGTTGPTAKLVVDSGSFAVQGISTPPTSGFGLEFWNNSATSYMGSYNRTTAVYRDLFFFANETIFQNAGTERMRITSAGNVGIGTTGPVNKLGIEVAANSNTKAINIYSKNTSPNSYTSIGSQYSISNTYVESEIRFGNETQSGGGSYLGFVAGGTNTGNTEKMRITSGGNVGIGTTSPDITGFGYTTLTVVGGTTAGYAGVLELGSPTTNANGQNLGIIAFMDGSTRNAQIDVTRASSTSTSNMHFYTNGGSGIEKRMSILGTTGELVLGAPTTTTISTDPIHSLGSVNRASLTAAMYARLVMQERTGNWISFVDGTPTHYGTISRSGSGVNYGSNSDYRLKENVLDLTNSINKVKLLSPKTFNFIDRPDTTVTGFLAHEVQKIVSEAVTGEKDGTITTGNVINDSDGTILEQNITEPEKLETGTSFTAIKTEPEYQQLDQAKLVPILIGALKELIAKVETLENN